jgi:hypothetical protein
LNNFTFKNKLIHLIKELVINIINVNSYYVWACVWRSSETYVFSDNPRI